MRYEAWVVRCFVALSTTVASKIPMVMNHWYNATTAPRIHLGALVNRVIHYTRLIWSILTILTDTWEPSKRRGRHPDLRTHGRQPVSNTCVTIITTMMETPTNNGTCTAAVCIATPTEKTRQEITIALNLGQLHPKGASFCFAYPFPANII